MWHSINMAAFNPYLSYETNRKNGVNLPEEWMPVLIYDPEDSKIGYFVGRFYQSFGLCCSTRYGFDYQSVGRLKWQEIDYYREEE